MKREEEMMEAGLAEMNRDKTRDLVQEKDREFKRREWDWENVIEDGSTREAFEPRGSEGFVCQKDGERKTGKGGRDERVKGGKERQEEGGKDRHEEGGRERQEEGGKERQEEGGKERQEEGGKEGQDKGEEGKEASRWQDDRHERHEGGNEVIWRQDDGQDEGGKGFRWQDDDDDDDKKQVEKQEDVVRRQLEDDRRQDEDGMGWAMDVWKKEDERSRELGKDSERVNSEDFFRRYKREQGEQQQQQGGRDWSEWESFSCRGSRHFESRGKDGGCEQE